MKTTARWKSALALGLLICSTSLFAASADDEDEKKCIKPKFRDFSPVEKSEVAPGSKISFHVSPNADPAHITAEAHAIKMKLDVKDRKTFIDVSGQLPEELSNSFARISIHAKAAEGDCVGNDGWLIKVKAKDGEAATPAVK